MAQVCLICDKPYGDDGRSGGGLLTASCC